jgi:prephenate dehydrogenase
MRVLIVGTGVIGTSLGLALTAAGDQVVFRDRDPERAAFASQLLGIPAGPPDPDPCEIVVAAVPPSAVGPVLAEAARLGLGKTFTDVAGIKTKPLADAESFGCPGVRLVGGHPMSGRERSGPQAARADLFQGRPWVLCPTVGTESDALETIDRMVRRAGALPVVLSPEEHDRAVALVSHLPQLAASALAAIIADAPAEDLAVAGPGLRDLLRVAGSDPGLWAEVAAGNARALAPLTLRLADVLRRVGELLSSAADETPDAGAAAASATASMVAAGNRGYARLPGKRGAPPTGFLAVPVVLRDQPGELARLFADAANAGVNVEDVSVEHAPGQAFGVVELSVTRAAASQLRTALRNRGWTVHE